MNRSKPNQSAPSLGLGVWLRAVVSGLLVMGGVMFVCIALPLAFQLGVLGVVILGWILVPVGLLLGVTLGILNIRQTIRLARRDRERKDPEPRPSDDGLQLGTGDANK